MQCSALGSELQHIAEHRDAPTEAVHRYLTEQRERCAHRGRIGVVALVDEQNLATRHVERHALAASGRCPEIGERECGEREISAEQ